MYNLYKKFKIYGFKKTLKYIGSELKYKYYQIAHNSYGQKQEDLIIDKLLNKKPAGFYVDIGAYDPHRFSNTKHFYQKGWRGINVEPDVHNYQKFLQKRPEDINLNLGISDKPGSLIFYKMFPETLSTFSQKEAEESQTHGYKLVEKTTIKTNSLANVLTKYSKNQTIDFMSVDTEGFDLIVLQSNNWQKYKPKVLCVESNTDNQMKIEKFLIKQEYVKFADNGLNAIYAYGGQSKN